MKISIIIPTHNRSDLLTNIIDNVLSLKNESDIELVIVDNNSTDNTVKVVSSYSPDVRYVFEKCTSFTKARSTGAENAKGDILLFLDDDVIVNPGSLENIAKIFKLYPECGVLGGKILPKYLEQPPQWTINCQKKFNGWSLYYHDPETFKGSEVKDVSAVPGPMMAIRRKAYDESGGFPADTVGVETNRGKKTFNKLYIGPGDYGLCYKIRGLGWKIYYSNELFIYHLIPPVRFTIKFWRSRMIGEGYHEAITQREFFKISKIKADIKRNNFQQLFYNYEKKLFACIAGNQLMPFNGMSTDELWVCYYKAYLDMDALLRKNEYLSQFLWQIGLDGVDDSNFDKVMNYLPEEFKQLVNDEYFYNNTPIDSITSYNDILKDFGSHKKIFIYSNRCYFLISMLLFNFRNRIKKTIYYFKLVLRYKLRLPVECNYPS